MLARSTASISLTSDDSGKQEFLQGTRMYGSGPKLATNLLSMIVHDHSRHGVDTASNQITNVFVVKVP